jgi:hypothetical protein
MFDFLADWRYWAVLLIGCVALELSRHNVPFWAGAVNGLAIGLAYFTHPKESP